MSDDRIVGDVDAEAVLDAAVGVEDERTGRLARGELGDVLADEPFEPREPLRSGEDHELPVATVDQRRTALRGALLGERIAEM